MHRITNGLGLLMTLTAMTSVVLVSAIRKRSEVVNTAFLNDTFPSGFQWGAATAAYQIEGAWNVGGKGPNIWDTFSQEGGKVVNNDTGDVACNSYELYPKDIANLKHLGVNFYRFSLSWARILPTGKLSDGINEPGVDYYNKLINGLKNDSIEPFITLYHWDLPQALQDEGGWLNESIVGHFKDFAHTSFSRFGDRVKFWLTFNEPFVVSWIGHGVGAHAPGMQVPDTAPYIVTHNIIKSHAEAWHVYNDNYRQQQHGQVSITLDSDWKEPLDENSQSDIEAAIRANQFKLGWFAHPIYVNGDYPEVMKTNVKRKSLVEGLSASRLPEFTELEKARINGTYDYFGLNHYTSQFVTNQDRTGQPPSWENDRDVAESIDTSWPITGSSWHREVPWGIRLLLGWIRDQYGNPPVYITENGVSDDPQHIGKLEDRQRIRFYEGYINNVLKAIKLDGCNVVGYTAWSLMDNFEWAQGYSETFGLYSVNFSDPDRPRTAKESVGYFKKLITDNGWPKSNNAASVKGFWSILIVSALLAIGYSA